MPLWLEPREMGRRIREVRKRLGLSQEELAAELGVHGSQSEVSKWELGKKPAPADKLIDLARMANLSIAVFEQRQRNEPDIGWGDGGEEVVERGGYEDLLTSTAALYQTLSRYGPPGDHEDDKISLIALLAKTILNLRREGRTPPTAGLIAAFTDLVNGQV